MQRTRPNVGNDYLASPYARRLRPLRPRGRWPVALNQLVNGGALDLEGGFLSPFADATTTTDFYVLSAQAPDGLLALRMQGGTDIWTLTVRGVDVLTATMGLPQQGTECEWRVQYIPSTGKTMVRIRNNGCLEVHWDHFAGGATNPALKTPTSVYVDSYLGQSPFFANPYTFLTPRVGDNGLYMPEGLILGDSIMTWGANAASASGGFVYTPAQARARAGIVSLAVSGNQVNDQLAAFNASPYANAATQGAANKWVLIQCGTNDLGLGGATPATVISRLQGLVNAVRAALPSTKIIIGRITPGSQTTLSNWQTVNTAIDGGGGTPITGVDYRVSSNSSQLDVNPSSPTNVMQAQYQLNSLHPNNVGRTVMMAPYTSTLVGAGLLS